MTSNSTAYNNIPSSPTDPDEKDPFTIKGYTKFLDSCESISKVCTSLEHIYGDISMNLWIDILKNVSAPKRVTHLVNHFGPISKKNDSWNFHERRKVIETISLLENVFRNTLLRPYIPAYRTINMDCGQYHCYVDSSYTELFTKLGFINSTKTLLTYTETDPLTTIAYALTCAALWRHFTQRLK